VGRASHRTQQAAFGQQLHQSIAAMVHHGPLVKISRAPSGKPSFAADRTPLQTTASLFCTAAIIAGENPVADQKLYHSH